MKRKILPDSFPLTPAQKEHYQSHIEAITDFKLFLKEI